MAVLGYTLLQESTFRLWPASGYRISKIYNGAYSNSRSVVVLAGPNQDTVWLAVYCLIAWLIQILGIGPSVAFWRGFFSRHSSTYGLRFFCADRFLARITRRRMAVPAGSKPLG